MNNNKRATKRALLTSVMALVMCVVMLVGTTFAWFTDTASTGVNKIQAGNLDIDLEYKKTAEGGFIKADKNAPVFNNDALWEPGHVEYVVLKISNAGTLALKYKLGINIAGEQTSTNVYNNVLKLSDHIKFAVLEGESENLNDRDKLVAEAAAEENRVLNAGYTDEDHLVPKGKEDANRSDFSEKIVTLVVWMPTTVGNEANYRGEKAPSIDLGISVVATQYTYESDSFNDQYDKFAQYPEVSTVAIPAGDKETVNAAVADAITAAKTVDQTTGKTTPTQIMLPANAEVAIASIPNGSNGNNADIKFTGDKSTKVSLAAGAGLAFNNQVGTNLTFQGVTVAFGNAGFHVGGATATFIDCTITGELTTTFGDKFVFSGCTFDAPVSQVGYGCKDVVFDNCEFNTNGYGIKIYAENPPQSIDLTVKNCKFVNSDSNAAKPAILLDHIADGISYDISVEGCTFSGFTTEPTATANKWAAREIVKSSFTQSDNQYIFAYQTGAESGSHHKILTAEQLVVTVK